MDAIEVTGLKKVFGQREAVRGISFRVKPGEVVAFLGPNGSGKSTTIRVLTGQLERDGGDVRVLGLDPWAAPLEVRRRMAFLPDAAPLYDVLTPREQLELVAGLRGLGTRTAQARATALMDAMGLAELAELPLGACSRGNRQRTALACAFVEPPQLVILDEPFFGLDAPTVLFMKEVLRRLAAKGVAVFYSSHLLDVAEQFAHRVVILREGEIVADGQPAALLRGQEAVSVKAQTLEELFRELTFDRDVEARAERFLTASGLHP